MIRSQPTLTLCELADTGSEAVESYSPFCLKVHRGLRSAGLRYERRFGKAPKDFRALNSTGQVPVLLVDREPVSDSTRILQRIDALTGAFTRDLDERQRAEAWLWEELSDTALNGFVVSARWAFDENWPLVLETYFGTAPWFVKKLIAPRLRTYVVGSLIARDVWRQGREACWERFLETLDGLDTRAPEDGFWVSGTITVADLGLFGQLQSFRTPLTCAHSQQLELRKRLTAYLDRVDAATRQPRSDVQAKSLASASAA
jgi:glutathione S-transferase